MVEWRGGSYVRRLEGDAYRAASSALSVLSSARSSASASAKTCAGKSQRQLRTVRATATATKPSDEGAMLRLREEEREVRHGDMVRVCGAVSETRPLVPRDVWLPKVLGERARRRRVEQVAGAALGRRRHGDDEEEAGDELRHPDDQREERVRVEDAGEVRVVDVPVVGRLGDGNWEVWWSGAATRQFEVRSMYGCQPKAMSR